MCSQDLNADTCDATRGRWRVRVGATAARDGRRRCTRQVRGPSDERREGAMSNRQETQGRGDAEKRRKDANCPTRGPRETQTRSEFEEWTLGGSAGLVFRSAFTGV